MRLLLLITLSLTSVYLILCNKVSYDESGCPVSCACRENSVRCMRRYLRQIPQIPDDTRLLDMRFNSITEVPSNTFEFNHRLDALLMNNNEISSLDSGAFFGLFHLRYLYLYNNKITTIDSDVFLNMPRLQQLYLHNNEITKISVKSLVELPMLERLFLDHNRLKRIQGLTFQNQKHLKRLRLENNPLICDCGLLWLSDMLYQAEPVNVTATCDAPDEMAGVQITELRSKPIRCTQPEIMSDPQDITVDMGADATFTCVVSGDPEPEIIWLRDDNKISLNKQRYEVMGNGTLMVHGADESDTGNFECMAQSSLGVAKSKPAKMVVKRHTERPKIIKHPENVYTQLGQSNARFNCVAIGDPIPRVSWHLNDKRLLVNDRIKVHRNGTVIVINVKESDAGVYTCIASNFMGKINSSAALILLSVPTFTEAPLDKTVAEGERVEFECGAIGNPTPDIIWLKNLSIIRPSDNVFINNSSRHLTILKASISDGGLYACRAVNREGLVEMEAVLRVKRKDVFPPKIITRPMNTEAYRETTVQLPCESESEPLPEFEWRKDGTRISTNERILITLIGSLVIRNLTLTDSGRYECSVFNKYGRDTVSAFLTVKNHIIPGDEFVRIALTQAERDIDQAIEKTIRDIFENKESNSVSDLFRAIRYPNAGARGLARAAEIYERTLTTIREIIERGLHINAIQGFNYNNILTGRHIELIALLSGCTAHRIEKDCSDMCYHKKYRSIDGSCNNLQYSMWGSSLTPFRRILLPVYENGFSHPRGWDKRMKYNGFSLPSARLVSTEIIKTEEISQDTKLTHMVMQWGQWLDHDLDHALPSVSSQTWDGVDCKKTCEYAAPCFPIEVPDNDPRIKNRRCIDFVRTSSVCGSGMTSVLFGELQAREQINQLTSYIDASQVYGFEESVAVDLRDLTVENGTLRVGPSFPRQKSLLPFTGINGMDCRRNVEESSLNCFVAGDIRANEQIGLAAFHTLWMREHNRLALKLKALNPFWNGDKIYNEARKIVGAEIQFITYEHWMPLIIGSEGMKTLGEYKGYDRNVNPSVSNVFATAALRFGHSMINPVLHRLDENFETIPAGDLLLRDAFFSPWRLVEEGGIDPLLRGMFITPAKLKTPTQNLNVELTERLFQSAHAVALDLAAINIQRGRDHAIPAYTKWRSACNMSDVNDFDDLKNEISSEEIRNKLKELYGNVYNIDVWVGGILEDQTDDAKVGPLFRCLLLEQFKRLRDGDRFWYESPTTFTPDQLQQIKETSLARVLCDNGDNIDTIGENVFLLPEEQEGLISCEDLPSMDLRYWVDCQSCDDDDDDTSQRSRREIRSSLVKQTDDNKQKLNTLEAQIKTMEEMIINLVKEIKSMEEGWRHTNEAT